MISLVIVSQNPKIAAGVEELARKMAGMPLKIARATSINSELAADETKVLEAIESVYNEDGVIVLVDVGSAIFSAQKALELLDRQKQERVKLCSAPIVEGTIAAALQIVAGADLDRVLAEARSAMSAKISFITPEEISLAKEVIKPEIKVNINKIISLDFAADLINLARNFSAKLVVKKANSNLDPVNLKSIDRLISLGIKLGDEIIVSATGEDEAEALRSLQDLLVGKELIIGSSLEVINKNVIQGIPATGGVVIGKANFSRSLLPEISVEKGENSAREWEKLQAALNYIKAEIERITTENNKHIFAVYLLFLEDPSWNDRAKKLIFQQEYSAANAWKIIVEESLANYEKDINPYLESLVTNIGTRVLQLLGYDLNPLELSEPGIILAYDLSPTEIINLKSDRVLGICLAAGSIIGDRAKITEMKNIPLIVGLGEKLWEIPANTEIGIDGYIGEISIAPDAEKLQDLTLKDSLPKKTDEWGLEPTTQDSYRFPVMANITGVADLEYLLQLGAEGVGLYRSEYLFLDRLTPPEETEQLAVYQAIAKILPNRPLTILTLNSAEQNAKNSLLGWRGIRQSLDNPTIFKTQLRAILKATTEANIKIMLPMVSSIQEIKAAKKIIAEVKRELLAEKIDFNENIPIGIAIESPAAIITIDRLATEVDFLGIDPNNLAQYIMAADRTNYKVAHLADPFEPAILQSIQKVIIASKVRGIRVSIFGQMASDSLAVPVLLGLGADELSLNGRVIPKIIKNISQLNLEEAEELAKETLQLESAIAVKNLVFNRLSGIDWDF